MNKKDKCKDCGKCCMIFEIGTLSAAEAASGKYEMYEDPWFPGTYHIKKHKPPWAPKWAKMGVCIYLKENMQCSIYENRPGLCKDFHCRENGKLTSRYHQCRRTVNNITRWTEYEHEVFGRFLMSLPRDERKQTNPQQGKQK